MFEPNFARYEFAALTSQGRWLAKWHPSAEEMRLRERLQRLRLLAEESVHKPVGFALDPMHLG